MSIVMKPINFVLGLLGFGTKDLPEIPMAEVSVASQSTPTALKRAKHVTFSPAREYIPDYPTDGVTPLKLISELQQVCPDQKLVDLYRIVEELKEHLQDAKNENARLLKEKRILMQHE